MSRMQTDLNRFKKIVKGRIRGDLRKFVANSDMIAKQGKKIISIPIPRIDIPRFKFDGNKQKGVGQGEGEVGDGGEKQPGQPGEGKASDQAGEHTLEVDVNLEDLARLLSDELELPNIEPKGAHKQESIYKKFSGITRQGPESLRHNKRTFREALKRSIAEGNYTPDDPKVIPFKADKRYRSFKEEFKPITSTVIIYMMDVSGSMGDEQKETVRLTSFWLDTWLKSQYKNLERRYIVHDAVAKEVDEQTFYSTKESGGTLISSAYKLALEMVEQDFNPLEWNVYFFHFSDGDNWSTADTNECMDLLNQKLLPYSNLFCYGQVDSRYGSGQFYRDLEKAFADGQKEELSLAHIKNKESIVDALKIFLGKGR